MEAIETTPEAVARYGKERLQAGDREDRHPEPGTNAGREKDERDHDECRSERLRKTGTEFGLNRCRRTETEGTPDERPRSAEEEPLGPEGGAHGKCNAHNSRNKRLVKHEAKDECDGGQRSAEALAARINGSNGDHG